MRLQPAKPWNAVIAETEHIARQYMEAFGLTDEMWQPLTIYQNTMGYLFDRIVLIRPHWRTTPAEMKAFELDCEAWSIRVNKDGHFKII